MATLLDHGRRKFTDAGLLASSAGRGWSGVAAELRRHPAGHLPPILPEQMEITLALTGNSAGVVQRRGNGTRQETRVTPGAMWLCPIGVFEDSIFISQTIEQVVHVYLSASVFAGFSEESRGAAMRPDSIGYIAGLEDPLVEEMSRAIVTELGHETAGGRLLMETLSLGLVARLANSYGAAPAHIAERASGAIDGRRLRRVLEFIGDELESDLSVERLAEVACLSRFHFSRAFKKAIGIPPHRYIAERRFEHAKALLVSTDRPLSEIALACRFSSQGNFSRAFLRAAGMTPGKYRASKRH
jgi:AraC family transcriptional regulator